MIEKMLARHCPSVRFKPTLPASLLLAALLGPLGACSSGNPSAEDICEAPQSFVDRVSLVGFSFEEADGEWTTDCTVDSFSSSSTTIAGTLSCGDDDSSLVSVSFSALASGTPALAQVAAGQTLELHWDPGEMGWGGAWLTLSDGEGLLFGWRESSYDANITMGEMAFDFEALCESADLESGLVAGLLRVAGDDTQVVRAGESAIVEVGAEAWEVHNLESYDDGNHGSAVAFFVVRV